MEEFLKIADLVVLLFLLGGAGGFLSGLLGVGGGILFVPGLYYCLSTLNFAPDSAMHVSVGTSMAIVLATGITSAYAHAKQQSVDKDVLKDWGRWIILGVFIGTLFAASVSGAILKNIFALALLALAPYMAFVREQQEGVAARPHIFSRRWQQALCTGVGILSSMIGVGGAIMNVPMMTYMGHSMRKAIGTSAALGVIISLPATISYILTGMFTYETLPPFSAGFVNVLALAILIPSAIFMAPRGVEASHKLSRRVLRRIFAVVLLVVSLRMLLS